MVKRIILKPASENWENDEIIFSSVSEFPHILAGLKSGEYVLTNTTSSLVQTVPAVNAGIAQAAYTVLSGAAPTIYEYVDATDQKWKAAEFKDDAIVKVTAGGEIEYEIVAGGGAAGGGRAYLAHGGGGAGGYKRGTLKVEAGEFPIVVGKGGLGSTTKATSGGDTEAFGMKMLGGGRGGAFNAEQPDYVALGGGSSGGWYGMQGRGPFGTAGQGNDGGGGVGNGAGGGGGAGGPGGDGSYPNGYVIGGNGGVGVSTDILGKVELIAGGGPGKGSEANRHGTSSHGAGIIAIDKMNATAFGSGGAAHPTSGAAAGGNGFQGRFVIRTKVV